MNSLSERYEQYKRTKDTSNGIGLNSSLKNSFNNSKTTDFAVSTDINMEDQYQTKPMMSDFLSKSQEKFSYDDIEPIGTSSYKPQLFNSYSNRYNMDYSPAFKSRYDESPIKVMKNTPISRPQKLYKSTSDYRPLQLSKIKKKPTKKSGYFSTLRQFLLGSKDQEKKTVSFNDNLRYSRINSLTDSPLLQDDIVDETVEKNKYLQQELDRQKALKNDDTIARLRKELEQERIEKQKLSNSYSLELKELQDDHLRRIKNLNETIEEIQHEARREIRRQQELFDEQTSRKYQEILVEKQNLLRDIESKRNLLQHDRDQLETLQKQINAKQRRADSLSDELNRREQQLEVKQADINSKERHVEKKLQELHAQEQEYAERSNELTLRKTMYHLYEEYIKKSCELQLQLSVIESDIVKNREQFLQLGGRNFELSVLEVEKSVFQKLRAMITNELEVISNDDTSISYIEKQQEFYEDLYQSMEEKKTTKTNKLQQMETRLALIADTASDEAKLLCKQRHRHLKDLEQVYKIFHDFHQLLQLFKIKLLLHNKPGSNKLFHEIKHEIDVVDKSWNFQ